MDAAGIGVIVIYKFSSSLPTSSIRALRPAMNLNKQRPQTIFSLISDPETRTTTRDAAVQCKSLEGTRANLQLEQKILFQLDGTKAMDALFNLVQLTEPLQPLAHDSTRVIHVKTRTPHKPIRVTNACGAWRSLSTALR